MAIVIPATHIKSPLWRVKDLETGIRTKPRGPFFENLFVRRGTCGYSSEQRKTGNLLFQEFNICPCVKQITIEDIQFFVNFSDLFFNFFLAFF